MRNSAQRPLVHTSFRFFFLVFVVLACIIGGLIFFLQSRINPLYRYGIAVSGENPVVVSWDPDRQSFIVIRIPDMFTVDAVHGYGSYAVKALWALDTMEKRNGTLFCMTVSDALGIPVQWFMEGDSNQNDLTDGRAWLRQTFSISNLFSIVFQRKKTNIPLPIFLSLIRQSAMAGVPSFLSFDIGTMDVKEKETLPDGSMNIRLDTTRFDALIRSTIEDDHIRSESLRVAIINTTDTSGLAQKTARLLEKSGVHVVTLDSTYEEQPVGKCVIKGKKEWEHTVTVAFIASTLNCSYERIERKDRADLTLYIGTEMKNRYLPYK